mmetsp:Transcript_6875/g.20564  ORF Transcript_6875/g.20564 Transcript_6875/m.20564 type:complete len:210 (+) Transcript_6875:186-815(+)
MAPAHFLPIWTNAAPLPSSRTSSAGRMFKPLTNSCATMPEMEIIAKRPLLISFNLASAMSSVVLLFDKPSGSKPHCPGMYSSFKENSSLVNGSDQPFWTRVDSNKKMVAPTKPQTNPGVCWKWLMAGPVTCASNKNEDPSTCSPTKKPTVAIMATRPCVISASLYRCKSPPLMPLQKPRMSRPSGNGAHAPSRPAAVASLMSAYLRDLS